LKKFEIVDGLATGYAQATLDISFDIPLYELSRIEGEAEDMDEFIEDMKYEIEEAVQFYIEAVMDNMGYHCSDEVRIDSCNQATLNQIDLEDVEAEELETEDVE
tara:strand:+ start:724 stop:1035 length:312 start_codon:yes stop_codon:yes gene_type:complete